MTKSSSYIEAEETCQRVFFAGIIRSAIEAYMAWKYLSDPKLENVRWDLCDLPRSEFDAAASHIYARLNELNLLVPAASDV